MTADAWIHPRALIDDGATVGTGTSVWSDVHIRAGARVGANCIVGEKSVIGVDVVIGSQVKINALVFVCSGVTIDDGAMVSAGTIFTNDRYPRATSGDLTALLASQLPDQAPTTQVGAGATIGARSVIGPGLTIGRFAMVGMGSVVTRPVPDFHLAVGHPARSVGWVCRCGQPVARFSEPSGRAPTTQCPACARGYHLDGTSVTERDPEGPTAAP